MFKLKKYFERCLKFIECDWKQVQIIKSQTNIPVCVGFGIKTPEDAKSVSAVADGVVVGSSIVELIEKNTPIDKICDYIKMLADAVHE